MPLLLPEREDRVTVETDLDGEALDLPLHRHVMDLGWRFSGTDGADAALGATCAAIAAEYTTP
jgi:hypothetical protein